MPNKSPVLNANERRLIHRMSEMGFNLVSMESDKTKIIFNMTGHKDPDKESIPQGRFKNWSSVLDLIVDFHGEDCLRSAITTEPHKGSEPVYKNTLDYAMRLKETNLYMNSVKDNIACLEDIQKAIHKDFDGLHIPDDTVYGLIKAPNGWGEPRMTWVLSHIVEANRDAFSPRVQKWADREYWLMGLSDIMKDEHFSEDFPKEYGYMEQYNPYKAVQGIASGDMEDRVKSGIEKNGPVDPYLFEGFIRQAIPVLNNEFIENTEIRMNDKGDPVFETDTRPSAGLSWVDPCKVTKTIFDYTCMNLYGRNQEDMGFHMDIIDDLYQKLYKTEDKLDKEKLRRSSSYEKLQIVRNDVSEGKTGAERNAAVLAEQIDASNDIVKNLEQEIKDIKEEINSSEYAENRTGIKIDCVKLYGDRMVKCVSDKGIPIKAVIKCTTDSPAALEAFNKALAEDPLTINGIHVEMAATADLEKFWETNWPDRPLKKKVLIYADMIPKEHINIDRQSRKEHNSEKFQASL